MVTVTRIDRLAPSTFDLFGIVKRIVDAKAQFRSLTEPWADIGTSTGGLMLAVLGGLDDVERRHCQLNYVSETSPIPDARSRGGDGILPLAGRFGSEYPERRARDEMALKVEGVVNGGMHAEKTLGGAS